MWKLTEALAWAGFLVGPVLDPVFDWDVQSRNPKRDRTGFLAITEETSAPALGLVPEIASYEMGVGTEAPGSVGLRCSTPEHKCRGQSSPFLL